MRAVLSNVPRTKEEWSRWSFHHRTSHDLIRTVIRQSKSVNLPDHVIDPMPVAEQKGWLENNQSLHTDMNTVLGKQAVDLEDLDFKNDRQVQAWIWQHYQEHVTAETALGVSS